MKQQKSHDKMTYLVNKEALYKNDMEFGVIHIANNQPYLLLQRTPPNKPLHI